MELLIQILFIVVLLSRDALPGASRVSPACTESPVDSALDALYWTDFSSDSDRPEADEDLSSSDSGSWWSFDSDNIGFDFDFDLLD